MKLSIAFPSIAALVLPCIVVADDRHVARFDVTKLFPDIDFRVDADPAFQSSTSDDNLSRVREYSDGRTYGTAFVYPSLIKKINHATNQDVSVDKDASFHKVQMLHMTQSSHRHVDGVREVVGSSIRLNPLKKWEATTAFYVQEASPDSYFETDEMTTSSAFPSLKEVLCTSTALFLIIVSSSRVLSSSSVPFSFRA
jgi:hypothetical protein